VNTPFRVPRVEGHVRRARVLVFVEHLLKRPAAVGRSENAPFFVWAVRMTQRRDKEPVRIARVDDDLRDLLRVAKAVVRPGLAAVVRAVDAVARGEVRALISLAAAYIDDVRIGRRDRDRADRARRLIVEDRHPGSAVVGRLPHAAVVEADEEGIRTIGDADCGLPASPAVGTDHAPVHLGQGCRRDRGARGPGLKTRHERDDCDAEGFHSV
jgi:hypothetical protein